MKFLDRHSEKNRLTSLLQSENASFVVVYGRRRIGKSTLLKNILTPEDIYFMADQTEKNFQLSLLSQEISLVFPDFDQSSYSSWESLLLALNYRTKEKFTLCLDEFPYLVKSAPELPSVLQKLIDSRQLKYNIILCGSSQQLMQGLVLPSNVPLYGRADDIIHLQPIPPYYLQEALETNAIQTIEEYAIWGGIPRYWELRKKQSTLKEAISHLLIDPSGLLFDEPQRLFLDDMRDVVQSLTILSLIGQGSQRLSEIASRLEKPATQLSGPLQKLIQLGYLEKEIPFNENIKSSKKSIYRIKDPFLNFYFRFIVPNRSLIELNRQEIVMHRIDHELPAYYGQHWETFCRNAMSGHSLQGTLYLPASRWWGNVSKSKRIEIDLLAFSDDKSKLLVGECKWTKETHPERILHDLEEKAHLLPFAKGKEIVPIVFLKESPVRAKNIITPDQILPLQS